MGVAVRPVLVVVLMGSGVSVSLFLFFRDFFFDLTALNGVCDGDGGGEGEGEEKRFGRGVEAEIGWRRAVAS